MAGDEVRNKLAPASAASDNLVEFHSQTLEKLERRLGHELEHRILSMFGSYLQTSGCMLEYEFLEIWI